MVKESFSTINIVTEEVYFGGDLLTTIIFIQQPIGVFF